MLIAAWRMSNCLPLLVPIVGALPSSYVSLGLVACLLIHDTEEWFASPIEHQVPCEVLHS
jgi:hypothetical protein